MSSFRDVVTIAVLGVVGFVGYEIVRNSAGIAQSAQGAVNTATNANQSVSWQIAGVSPGDYCGAIANWRQMGATAPLAGGILGFGAFDPTDWNQFTAYLQTIGVPTLASPPSCWYGQNPSINSQQYGPYGPEGY